MFLPFSLLCFCLCFLYFVYSFECNKFKLKTQTTQATKNEREMHVNNLFVFIDVYYLRQHNSYPHITILIVRFDGRNSSYCTYGLSKSIVVYSKMKSGSVNVKIKISNKQTVINEVIYMYICVYRSPIMIFIIFAVQKKRIECIRYLIVVFSRRWHWILINVNSNRQLEQFRNLKNKN